MIAKYEDDLVSNLEERSRKFNMWTTAAEVLEGFDLRGKTVIVTGANSGCGYETAKSLANHGAKVIMACRNMDAAKEAIIKIKRSNPYAKLLPLHLDLADLKTVETFADEFLKLKLKLDVLICNAGIASQPHQMTKDGFELTFQVVYLGHVYLTKLLLDKLIESSPSRIIFLSSMGHWMSTMNKKNLDVDYLSPKKAYFTLPIYGNGKMALNLITRYLAKKHAEQNISVFSVNPGGVNTPLAHRLFRPVPEFVSNLVGKLVLKSPEQGAATSVYCAVYPIEHLSGSFMDNCKKGWQSFLAEDDKLAEMLWNLTEDMINDWKKGQRVISA